MIPSCHGQRQTLLLLIACTLFPVSEAYTASQVQNAGKPNIVLIVADDMRADDLAYMPKTQNLIAQEGIEYENAFVTTPVCCPSRASILRGQYAHNHRVLDNRGGFQKFNEGNREHSTVATWLHDVGYKTLLVGKYLNGYDNHEHIPPGWDEWYAKLGDHTPYYGYSLSENGKIVRFGTAPEDCLTDVTESQVRAHRDSQASVLSEEWRARAFRSLYRPL